MSHLSVITDDFCKKDPNWSHFPEYIKDGIDVEILGGAYAALLILCGMTLIVRGCASRYYGLPFFATHVFFLMLILIALWVRIMGFYFIPCVYSVQSFADGGTVAKNVLANTPIMLMFTIFTMLLYHTFVVVHSIHLSYDAGVPRVPSTGSIPVPVRSPASTVPGTNSATAATFVPSIGSLIQSGSRGARDFTWQANQSMIPIQPNGCCHIPFWVVLCGRPRSLWLMLITFLNAVMWATWFAFLAVLIFDSKHSDEYKLWAVSLLEFPAIAAAIIISVCFITSGFKLIFKLRDLQLLLHSLQRTEILDSGAAAAEGSNGSDCDSYEITGTSPRGFVVLSTVAPPSASEAPAHDRRPSGSGSPEQRSTQPFSLDHTSLVKQERRVRQDDPIIWNSMPDLSPFGRASLGGSTGGEVQTSLYPRSSCASSALLRHRSGDRGMSTLTRRSRVTFVSTMTASLALVYDEPSIAEPCVTPVISGVKRMLAVVCVCVGAFFFRAGVILYCVVMQPTVEYFPRKMWLPYLLISEVAPYALLLLFYFIPGCSAIYFGAGTKRRDSIAPTSSSSAEQQAISRGESAEESQDSASQRS